MGIPARFEVPAAIGGIVQHDVSLEPIRQGWDDLLCVAATIDEGWRFDSDIRRARRRVAHGSQLVTTRCGPIEYQEAGSGSRCWPFMAAVVAMTRAFG